MKRLLSLLSLTTAVLAFYSLEAASSLVNEGSVFAQLSSLQTQIPANGAQMISFANVDANVGFDHSSSTKLVVKQTGSYFLMAAAQVGADKNATAAGGYVNIWLSRNNQVIPNTAARQYIYLLQSTSVLVSQTVLNLHAGDAISVGYSANQPLLGLIATPATITEPAIPSVIFSIFKVK